MYTVSGTLVLLASTRLLSMQMHESNKLLDTVAGNSRILPIDFTSPVRSKFKRPQPPTAIAIEPPSFARGGNRNEKKDRKSLDRWIYLSFFIFVKSMIEPPLIVRGGDRNEKKI